MGNVLRQRLRALIWRTVSVMADVLRFVARSLWRVFARWPRPLLYKLLLLVCFVGALVEGTYLVAFAPAVYAVGSIASVATTAPPPPPTAPPPVYIAPTVYIAPMDVPTIAPV